jgi:hypothetical protein
MTRVYLSQKKFEGKKDIDNDGKIWTLLDAYTSLKEARKLAREIQIEGAPWGKKTGGTYIAKILNAEGIYHLVYYRRKKELR